MTKKVCSNCKNKPVYAIGRCIACRTYWQRNGVERPERLWNPPKRCTNCNVRFGEKARKKRGLCGACAEYKYVYGKPRPERLWNLNMVCQNPHCERPLPHTTRRYYDLCEKCRLYWSLTGQYMPKGYCNHSRWCDCGNEATIETVLTIGGITKNLNLKSATDETFWLCQSCYDLEMETT